VVTWQRRRDEVVVVTAVVRGSESVVVTWPRGRRGVRVMDLVVRWSDDDVAVVVIAVSGR
jgi:hypothetical protein